MNLLTDLKLKVWRQAGPDVDGYFETYDVDKVSDEASFLEMLDQLNERLIGEGKEAVVFDHDCREGICGTCSLMINGRAHGPQRATTTCQLHMRTFKSGDEIVIEPWRASAFPIIKDLMVDRSSFDRIVEAGGLCQSQLPMRRWILRRASVAVHVLLHAPMVRRTCLLAPKFRTLMFCHKVRASVTSVPKQWCMRWMISLARVRTTASVRLHVRKRFRWMSSR
ncbi:MAG: succinate dehydrogenase iron-sulfur protein [Actinomycetota bacterium]